MGAFAAGLAVVLLNQSLCDCFLEYGDVSSEMAMLLAFVLFGEWPDGWTWTGTMIVFGATRYSARREALAARRGGDTR